MDDLYSENGLFTEHFTYSYTVSFARISFICCVSHVPAHGLHNDIGRHELYGLHYVPDTCCVRQLSGNG